MAIVVKFVGYIQYQPNHFQPEFVITGSDKLPDGSQISADTLLALGIKRPTFDIPDYWHWVRGRFLQMLKNRKILKELEK